MYNLKVDNEIVSTHETLEEAFTARNAKVRKILNDLYDDDVIDKEAMVDWGFGLEENKDMEFYINEHCGYAVDIEEVNPTPKKKATRKKKENKNV